MVFLTSCDGRWARVPERSGRGCSLSHQKSTSESGCAGQRGHAQSPVSSPDLQSVSHPSSAAKSTVSGAFCFRLFFLQEYSPSTLRLEKSHFKNGTPVFMNTHIKTQKSVHFSQSPHRAPVTRPWGGRELPGHTGLSGELKPHYLRPRRLWNVCIVARDFNHSSQVNHSSPRLYMGPLTQSIWATITKYHKIGS